MLPKNLNLNRDKDKEIKNLEYSVTAKRIKLKLKGSIKANRLT